MDRSRFVFLALAAVLAASSLLIYSFQPRGVSRSFQLDAIARVHRVVDGDTVWVYSIHGFKEGQRFKVRLADIDAPEPGKKGYKAARDELNSVLHAATCIVLDVDDPPYDAYSRVVAVVYVPYSHSHLLNVNTRLVERGVARYVDYPGSFHPEDFEYFVEVPPELQSLLRRHCS